MREEVSFKEKLKTLHFGIVPGASRATSSGTYFDKDALAEDGIPTLEETNDRRATALRRIQEIEDE